VSVWVVSVAERSTRETVATSANAETLEQEVPLVIPLDYHLHARQIASECIAAGEAAAQRRWGHDDASEQSNGSAGRQPLHTSLLAALLARLPWGSEPVRARF
jgi:hypothetical protein